MLLPVLLWLIVAGTLWAWPRAQPLPAAPHLAFRGTLTHHWNGPVNAHCGMQFQLYDAELNGKALGNPLTIADVPIVNGAFDVSVAPAQLLVKDPAVEQWLAVGVTCPGDDPAAALLGPRIRHHTAADDWELPVGTSKLLCVMPIGATTTHPDRSPSIEGIHYRLTGGFWKTLGD